MCIFAHLLCAIRQKSATFVDVHTLHPWPNPRKQLINQHNKTFNKMKKTYTNPAIEITDVVVEAGIAASQQNAMMDEIWLEEVNGGNPIW